MKLNIDQIRAVCQGAVRIEEKAEGVHFYRFTGEQEELYRLRSSALYEKALSTAGIKLCFETDSTSLFLKVNVTPGSSRSYFSIDVMVNGECAGHLDNFAEEEMPAAYTTVSCPMGEFSKDFSLGQGIKEVCIYLPWSMVPELQEISLDDGACVKPVRTKKKLLAFGDSITHGYDALRPSNRYIAKLAAKLGAEEVNKAIGGERFFPALAETKEPFSPDYITVAYGTNDWSGIELSEFRENCRAFYGALARNYPQAKIFAITPIWRKDSNSPRNCGEFSQIAKEIKAATKDYANIVCVEGYDFVPHEESYFADLRLHPNDAGFECYAQNLWEQVKGDN